MANGSRCPAAAGPQRFRRPPWWPHCGHFDRQWSVTTAASEAITGRYTVQPQASYHRTLLGEVVMGAARPVCDLIDILIHFDARCAVSWQLIPSCKSLPIAPKDSQGTARGTSDQLPLGGGKERRESAAAERIWDYWVCFLSLAFAGPLRLTCALSACSSASLHLCISTFGPHWELETGTPIYQSS